MDGAHPVPITGPNALFSQCAVGASIEFVRKINPTTFSEWKVTDRYTSGKNGVTHVYLKQMIDGYIVANGDVNINFDGDGRVLSFGDSSYIGKKAFISSSSYRCIECFKDPC